MTLTYSVDKLYESGWKPEAATGMQSLARGLERLPDGRAYPSVMKVQELFAGQGFELAIRFNQLFDCYRAVWTDAAGNAVGAVVGADELEAAVFALAQLRKSAVGIR